MSRKHHGVVLLFLCFMCLTVANVSASSADPYGAPLTDKEMEPYEKISFSPGNMEMVQRGMTEKQVLEILGKPLKVKKEHRRHNRWTVHYFYPEGHVVNFKNGLVVGKE